MEKLVELLNEYNRNVKKWSDKWELKNSIDNPWTKYISLSSVWAWKIYLWIISREYWFIKRLVENDNINREEIKYSNLYIPLKKDFNKDDRLIMLLSISENPIEFLISMLK